MGRNRLRLRKRVYPQITQIAQISADQAEVEVRVEVDARKPETGDWGREETAWSVIGLPSSVIQLLSFVISSFVLGP
jgi:hypothetical protein